MTLLQSIILGIIQGLTEFLPISSSGHLVIVPELLGWQFPAQDAFVFNVLVQVATLIAVIVYFWHDLLEIIKATLNGIRERHPFATPNARMGWYIVLATIPAGLAGLLLNNWVEQAFDNPSVVAIFLMGTAFMLLIAELLGKRQHRKDQLTWLDALWIGIAQSLAIFPGISRSGATITGGMLRNLKRPSAARFSFLISVPIMLAAGLLAIIDLLQIPHWATLLPNFIAGFIAAAVVGYLSIRWLLNYLQHKPLYIFAAYCATLSIISLIIFNTR
jgi:undecaprenyl-diphosphatase